MRTRAPGTGRPTVSSRAPSISLHAITGNSLVPRKIARGADDLRDSRPDWNWVEANALMHAALEFKDYDHKYVFGEGGHSGNHGGAIFPDTMRWIWRDYQK